MKHKAWRVVSAHACKGILPVAFILANDDTRAKV
jgi:hypothetical protein